MWLSSESSSYYCPYADAPIASMFARPEAECDLAGGGLLTTIMIYGRRDGDNLKMLAAIALSFSVVITVLLLVPLLQRLLGQRGMSALEQLMGLVLAMLSIELILQGTTLFISTVG